MEEKSLSYIAITLIVAFAIFFDGIQFVLNFIPVLGQILNFFVDIFAFLTFYVWFKSYGISFMTRARFLAMGGAWIVELVPILNDLPAWTAAVLIIIGTTKGVEVMAKVSGSKMVGFAVYLNKLNQKIPWVKNQKEGERPGVKMAEKIVGGVGEANRTIENHPAYSRNRQAMKNAPVNSNGEPFNESAQRTPQNSGANNVLDLNKKNPSSIIPKK